METTGKTMTVKEILTDVCKVLGDIDVPASKIEQIGIPIARSINGIQICIDAMNREEAEEKQKAESAAAAEEVEGNA